MKKLLLLTFIILSAFKSFASEIVSNPYQNLFNQAYAQYPTIPRGMLEAVSYGQTRFNHIVDDNEHSCVGLPDVYGVMGLTEDGKNYFRNNLITVSQLSGYSVDEIKSSPAKNILAYAKAFSILQTQLNTGTKADAQIPVLIALCELPDNDLQTNFALNAYLYQIYWFMNDGQHQDSYGFPDHKLNLETIFGAENFKILSSPNVVITNNNVKNLQGNSFKTNSFNSVQSADYAPALWNPAASCNQSSRAGTAVSAVTIHDVEGSYAGCISWFQNCAASVSAHYVVRSSDGQITQMVLESGKAWHVGSENPYCIGIEHEGYNNVATWYTTAMLSSSGALCKDICNSGYGIDPLRTYNGPSCNGLCTLGSCVRIKGHQHFPNQSHNDPGPYWNWYKFYNYINDAPTITTVSTANGTVTDAGGAGANYADDQRTVILIQPAGATTITLNFTQFDLELNWDYLFIYDGATTSSTQIGRYTGNTLPSTITSTGGSLLLDFRSDCATTAPGFVATYTSNATPQPIGDVVAPTTLITNTNAWETANFTANFNDADNVGGSGLEKSYYQVIDFDGTEWRANNTRGFFADNFDNAIHSDWTQKVGTWSIISNGLNQSDEVSSNTNIYAPLTQNLSNRYLYHFVAKLGGSGTNRRAGFHFFSDAPDSTNRGNGYFVWFRLDNQKLQIYECTNNSFGSPVLDVPVTIVANQYYDFKVIYDRITGKITVYKDNIMIGTYTDPTPIASGTHISFRTGNATMDVNELKIYRSRTSTSAAITVGPASTNDIRYQNPNDQTFAAKIKSICADSVGNLSTIDAYDLNIDWTPPTSIATINDGAAADLDLTDTTTSLSANWSPSSDPNSNVTRYWVAIGTTPGATNVLPFTSNWAGTGTYVSGLNLQHGQMYYFSVMAENGAGLFSSVITSDGILVDTTSSTIGIKDNSLSALISNAFPNPFTNTLNIRYNVTEESDVTVTLIDVLGKEQVLFNGKQFAGKQEQLFNTSNLANGTYILRLRLNDKIQNIKVVKR